jgi:nucleoside-diphosphate-sugar epimerase
MDMNVLITGVPGWLGSRFVEVLMQGYALEGAPVGGWRIKCLADPGSDVSSLNMWQGNLDLVRADITRDKAALADACRGMDIVFHIAGIIHPPLRRLRQLYDVNTQGTRNLLGAAAAGGVRRFVYVSSNSPIGCNRSAHELFTEETPYNPYLNYGLSKYYAELAVQDYQRAGALETVVLRPCWFYGPEQPRRQTRFFKMIQKATPIVFGNGQNLRSMSYVDNTCQALLLAAEKPAAAGNTYWVADRRPYSMQEIYETVADLLNVKLRPRYVPGFLSDVCETVDRALQACNLYEMNFHVAGEMNKHIACDVAKAGRELGYDPPIELREGMRRSIEWCRKVGYL